MKKRDIVNRIAGEAGVTKQEAEVAVGGVFASIAEALARGDDVTIAGFGRFARTERAAHEGRNPRTGERIAIGPSSGVSFRASKALKDALN
ncbi:MAG: HU family DNA-binding protein [Defluviicoccus sp.]|nr:HU family DNA-binding protein [Defluviicoccus sp.]